LLGYCWRYERVFDILQNMHSGWETSGNDRTGVDDPIRAVRDSVDTLTAHLDVDAMTDAEIASDLIRVRKLVDRLQAVAACLTTKAHQRGRRHRGRPRLDRGLDPLEDRPEPDRRPARPAAGRAGRAAPGDRCRVA
jgi:hypothetical protein